MLIPLLEPEDRIGLCNMNAAINEPQTVSSSHGSQFTLRSLFTSFVFMGVFCVMLRELPHVTVFTTIVLLALFFSQRLVKRVQSNSRTGFLFPAFVVAYWCLAYVASLGPAIALLEWIDQGLRRSPLWASLWWHYWEWIPGLSQVTIFVAVTMVALLFSRRLVKIIRSRRRVGVRFPAAVVLFGCFAYVASLGPGVTLLKWIDHGLDGTPFRESVRWYYRWW